MSDAEVAIAWWALCTGLSGLLMAALIHYLNK